MKNSKELIERQWRMVIPSNLAWYICYRSNFPEATAETFSYFTRGRLAMAATRELNAFTIDVKEFKPTA